MARRIIELGDIQDDISMFTIYLNIIQPLVPGLFPRMIYPLAGFMAICNRNRERFFGADGKLITNKTEIYNIDADIIYTKENKDIVIKNCPMTYGSFKVVISQMRHDGLIGSGGMPNYMHPVYGQYIRVMLEDIKNGGIEVSLKLNMK